MSLLQQDFDRICKLQVFQTQAVVTGPVPTLIPIDPLGVTFSSKQLDGSPGYRIRFHVDLVTGPVPVPNPAVIHIYNLGQTSRTLVSKLNNKLILQAGYGLFPQTIFTGQIQYAVTKKEGADYVTEIHASDGIFAFQNSVINTSFSTAMPAAAVITTLVGALAGAGVTPGVMTGIPKDVYNKGVVLSGKVTDQLQKICDKNNLTWTIENGLLNIVPIGGGFLPKNLVLLTEATGLIGIPEQREVDATGNSSLVSFRCLMNPSLGTFQKIIIQSKFIPAGFFTTAKITHSGDTYTNDWYTDGECTTDSSEPA